MGVSEKVQQMESVDSEKWVISGISLRGPLKPIFTKRDFEEEECNSTTPTSAESRIPRKLPCPPAPKKRKPGSSRWNYSGVREFFNPPDLDTIFIRPVQGA